MIYVKDYHFMNLTIGKIEMTRSIEPALLPQIDVNRAFSFGRLVSTIDRGSTLFLLLFLLVCCCFVGFGSRKTEAKSRVVFACAPFAGL